ncbi:MAG: hypothetical protein P8075_02605 [Deltaproteobacteria bacterium]|jgi:hypothetical protein
MEQEVSAGSRQRAAGRKQCRDDRRQRTDDGGQGDGQVFSMKYMDLMVLLPIFLFLSCASHQISTREYNDIKATKTWYLCLSGEMEIFEKALDSEEVGEIKSRKSVLLRCDVQLLDAIASSLVNKHKIEIVKKPNSTSGYIRIESLCRWEQYISADINIYGPKQNLLAKVKVKNGEDFFVKNDEEFAEYCADIIAGIVLGPWRKE